MSEKYRTKTLEWFSNTFVSRLNNKKDGVIIIVMQRLHQNDLTGYLLEKSSNEWTLLSIPAIETIRSLSLNKRIGVLFPIGRFTNELKQCADFSRKITTSVLRECLFEKETAPDGWYLDTLD